MDLLDIETRLIRNEAYAKIQNIMGTYAFMLTAAKYMDICELFTKNKPDVRVEMNWGVYDGYEGILSRSDKCHISY